MFIKGKEIRKAYFIGIKGVGMTMLAQFLKDAGVSVSGSDIDEVFITDEVLASHGISVREYFDADELPMDCDLYVYSTAYTPEKNVELAKVQSAKKFALSFPQLGSLIFNEHYGIAVAGSHGKTTTSAWLAFVLREAGLEPKAMIGASVPQFGGNFLSGKSDYLVMECDEYQDKISMYEPKAAILNNIDYDHPDYFQTKEQYLDVFARFVAKIPKRGWLAYNSDDQAICTLVKDGLICRPIACGFGEQAYYQAYDLKHSEQGVSFSVRINDDEAAAELGVFSIALAGEHNVRNALAVIAAAIELDVPLHSLRAGLADFTGTTRRLQLRGEYRGALIIDDYAHHPTEIRSSLSALRARYPDRRLIIVFNPHTFSRTKALLTEFADSFALADEVIVMDIYGSAREEQGGVHSRDLLKLIQEKHPNLSAQYQATKSDVEKVLRSMLGRNDVAVLAGAGDVYHISDNLLA